MRHRTGFVVVLLSLVVLFPRSSAAGGPVTSGSTVAGSLSGPTYLESWTFAGTVGQRVAIAAVTTSGAVNTYILLRKPGGTVETETSADRFDIQLTATGTYTIEITDVGLNDAGSYALGLLNITAGPWTSGADLDGGPVVSADVESGTTSGAADIDAWTFAGTNGDRVHINTMETAGASYSAIMYLYPPGGAGYYTVTSSTKLDVQLNATGTWTVTIEDSGNDTAGSYALSLLNVTAGPLENGGDADGDVLVSNQLRTGQFHQGVDMDAFTFTGTAGQRVVILGLATGGGTHDTYLGVYPPGGGSSEGSTSADRFEVQLAQTGTYTIVVEDAGNNHTGTYTLGIMNLSAGPYTDGGDMDGGAIVSADVKTGANAFADIDTWTFTGTSGDRVIINAVATGGANYNTTIFLYPPGGAGYYTVTGGDKLDVQLTATGTWKITVEDSGNDNAGNYSLSFLNVTAGPHENGSDADGEVIVSNDIKTGQFHQGVDMDAFTFSGTAGQRVVLLGLATGAGTHNTYMGVYPPGGGASEGSTSADRFDVQLAQTGTYTIVIEDSGDDNTGTYTLAFLNVTGGPHTDGGDLDGGAIVSADVKTGANAFADIDAWTFTGTSGNRVIINAVATGGASYNTTIYLYPPGGAGYYTVTGGDKLDVQLNATGTWTITIEDNSNDTAGNYALSFLNVTAGPLENGSDADGEVIVSNEIKTGQFHQGVDMDAFTFTGTAGQRVVVLGLATGGGTHDTYLGVYPPGGGSSEGSTSADRLEVQLAQTGTYTIVVEDSGDNNTGTYTLAFLNLTGGPHTNGSDMDGGAIVSADVKTGANAFADIDAWTFTGTSGDRVIINAVATGGASYNTTIYLYPPGGAGYYTVTGGDKLDVQLNATGTWTITIEDNSNDTAGNYALTLLNVTAGPRSNGTDTDGGTITSNQIKTGQFQQGVDMDAYTFTTVQPNQRIVVAGLATGAGTHDTYLSVYPVGGGAALAASSADRFDVKAVTAGTYVLVVEDSGDNDTGTYTVTMMNASGGPFTGGGDTGGPIASDEVFNGSMSGVADIDAYRFSGSAGSRVVVSAVATGGMGFNTTIYLYPPNGESYATVTGADRLELQLNVSGLWTILVEDNGNDTPGDYTVSYLDVTAGPYTSASDANGGPIADNVAKNGSAGTVADFDGYTFFGIAGQTINVNCIATSGAMNTYTTVYPPFGGATISSTSADNFNVPLAANGFYTVVVEDAGQNETGNYTLTVDVQGTPTGIGDGPSFRTLALLPAAPSPFSYATRLGFQLPNEARVQLRVYDVTGARVRSLTDRSYGAGAHAVSWDGLDDRGRRVASGVYYVTLEASGEVKHQKVVLVR